MTLIWDKLTLKPKQQEDIKKLYKELTGKEFIPPIENRNELAKQMKKPAKFRRRPK